MNKKNYIVTILISLILIISTISLYNEYIKYEDNQLFKQNYRKYNSTQKKCNVVGSSLNYIYIKRNKTEIRLKKGVEGSEWKLVNTESLKEYTFKTDADGFGGLVGFENGIYTLEEINNPEDEVLDCKKTLIFDRNNSSYEIRFSNSLVDNFIYVYSLDQNNELINNVTYEIYDSEFNLISNFTSNNGGMITSNLKDRIYYVRNVNYDIYNKVNIQNCEETDVEFIIRR